MAETPKLPPRPIWVKVSLIVVLVVVAVVVVMAIAGGSMDQGGICQVAGTTRHRSSTTLSACSRCSALLRASCHCPFI